MGRAAQEGLSRSLELGRRVPSTHANNCSISKQGTTSRVSGEALACSAKDSLRVADDKNVKFLPAVERRDLSGVEPLAGTDGKTVLDFWRWAHSDVLENVQRGVFAEYLIAAALDITSATRIGWAGYDLDYEGTKIEVKSSAYLQTWRQRDLSKILFSIGARQQFDESGSMYDSDPRYVADCYVFCVFTDTDGPTADVLDAGRWIFYVVAISDLIEACKTAKTVSEARVKTITPSIKYSDLKRRIDDVLAGIRFAPASAASPAPPDSTELSTERSARPYLVAERKTRAHPVVVNAGNYQEAHLLARADETIASFGTHVSAFELSKPRLEAALAEGAIDLRFRRPRDKSKWQHWSDEELRQLHDDYEEHGTLEAVGQKYGLTRQRIQQLLVLGEKRGLFLQPQNPANVPIDPNLLERVTREATSFDDGLRILGRSDMHVRRLLRDDKYAQAFQRNRRAALIERIDSEYQAVKAKIGHEPNSYDLQRTPESRAIYTLICSQYGGIDGYYHARSISRDTKMRRADVMRIERFMSSPEALEERKREIAETVKVFTTRLGRIPKVLEYLNDPDENLRNTYRDIRRVWGNMSAFYGWLHERNGCSPPPGPPN